MAADVGAAAPQRARSRSSLDAWKETPGEWARRARRWDATQGDLISGYLPALRACFHWGLAGCLAAYAVYLLDCEGCLASAAEVAEFLFQALCDFVAGVRGSPSVFLLCLLALLAAVWRLAAASPTVYCVDFATAAHPADPALRVTADRFMEESRLAACFSDDSLAFQQRMLSSSGVGENSTFPSSIFGEKPQSLNFAGARREAEEVMLSCVASLLESVKHQGVVPRTLDVLVVNCSLFCPTPSLASMVVNRFKLRPDVLSYNLGGMGCSANVIAVDLAARVLCTLPRGSTALVVSTENITQNWYRGNERSMLLSNCLFRCGAAAVLLRTLPRWRTAAAALRMASRPGLLRLDHVVRTHMGQSDQCYESVYQREDAAGVLGVALSKQIMQIAGDALKSNITVLAPRVLPLYEQLRFFLNMLVRRALRGRLPCLPAGLSRSWARTVLKYRSGRWACGVDDAWLAREPGASPDPPPYVPDFTSCFAHVLVHTGGRAVIDAVETNLHLPPSYLTPSRETLREYGNTSSASIWYEMDYLRRNRKLRRGDRVWQIAFGSGFKCNSAVWRCL